MADWWKIVLNIFHMYVRFIFVFHIYLSQVSRRRGEIVCIRDAVCDISSLWLYPCANTVWKLDRFNMSSVEEHVR